MDHYVYRIARLGSEVLISERWYKPTPDDVVSMLLRPPAERPGGTAPDLWADLLGLDLLADRRADLLALFKPIAAEIAKLRKVDLTDVHPAVVIDPRTPS